MHELADAFHLERGQERVPLREVVVSDHVSVDAERARLAAQILHERVVAQRKLVDHRPAPHAAKLVALDEERHTAERRSHELAATEVDPAQILAPGHAPPIW